MYSYSSWSNYTRNENQKKVQIDLVVDRSDDCINLCEIKFHNQEFVISPDYADNLLHKKQMFVEATKTKKTVFLTMITCFGTKENSQYLETIDNQLTINDLFSK